jgi:hypothetical protein
MPNFFHVSPNVLSPGQVLQPGQFGQTSRRVNSRGGIPLQGIDAMNLLWEIALETARQLLAPEAPSRLHCVFTTLTVPDAIAFRERFRPGSHIYEVLCPDEIPRHSGNYSAITDPPDETHVLDFMPDFAINYWREASEGITEVLIGGPVTVVRLVE